MKIIIDTNILLSALIKNSTTRKILIRSDWEFYYPKISLNEIKKHEDMVIRKSDMKKENYEILLSDLLNNITLVKQEEITNLDQAKEIMRNIDPDDTIFIAAALSIKDSIIWTDDKHFNQQKEIKTYNTQQMMWLFEMLNS
jgi:predicted nucleic acid-binding protein